MSKPKLAIVIGSIRPNRFAAHAGEWIEQAARQSGQSSSTSRSSI
jgi:hypothetical protein